MELSNETGQALLAIACMTIQARLGASPQEIRCDDPAVLQPAGCFVSLHTVATHALRGCIGLLESDQPLLHTVIGAAKGVLKDPRFTAQPITQAELPQLEVEITVLDPMRQTTSPLDFDPSVHGIYLTISDRMGCFLPQVAKETGWSREQLLSRLCTEKMGLNPQAWKDSSATLRIFTVQILGPRPFALQS